MIIASFVWLVAPPKREKLQNRERNFAFGVSFYAFFVTLRFESVARMKIEDLALVMTRGLGAKGVAHLLEMYGDATSVFSASESELIHQAQMREDVARAIARRDGWREAEREAEYCHRHSISILASTDEAYPKLLRETADYPHIIYVRGAVEALSRRCISFVGTRRMTPYGERACSELIAGLAARIPDLCIVSGLAFGIDSAAHRAALINDVPTVAAVANPLPGVTPTQHTALAEDVIAHGGAIVSELPSSTPKKGCYYISRNRIIAALGSGTVVVESHAGGGALTTAQFADDYNRSVMAVPGRMFDSAASGTNHLIRSRRAQLVTSAEDIINELMWDLELPTSPSAKIDPTLDLTPDEKGLLCCFRTSDPLSVGELMELSGMPSGELSALLMSLELAGAVRLLPGNMYEKLV